MSEMTIYMNIRKRDDKKYPRHFVDKGQGQTICGLSLKSGHGWAISKAQFVTCQKCQRIEEKRTSNIRA